MSNEPTLPREADDHDHDDDDVDGCDLDFAEVQLTDDEDLPASYGGTD